MHQSMKVFIVSVCYFFMTIVDISTSAKDGKLSIEEKNDSLSLTHSATTLNPQRVF